MLFLLILVLLLCIYFLLLLAFNEFLSLSIVSAFVPFLLEGVGGKGVEFICSLISSWC